MTRWGVWVLLTALVVVRAAPAAAQMAENHQHGEVPAAQGVQPASAPLPDFIPELSDADREAAFPDVQGHTVHDDATFYYVLLDQLEWRGGEHAAMAWDTRGWIGKDRDRLWFRSEGDAGADGLDESQTHALYGRQISTWWDVVAGMRLDAAPGPARAWAAFGLQGLAPYWFEVELTGYVGAGGRTQVRLETEYELLLTNRLVLQPLVEVEVNGKSDPDRGAGAGLSRAEVGLRLRYEFRREIAPYVGVLWTRPFFGTARAAAPDERTGNTRLVVGGRFWF